MRTRPCAPYTTGSGRERGQERRTPLLYESHTVNPYACHTTHTRTAVRLRVSTAVHVDMSGMVGCWHHHSKAWSNVALAPPVHSIMHRSCIPSPLRAHGTSRVRVRVRVYAAPFAPHRLIHPDKKWCHRRTQRRGGVSDANDGRRTSLVRPTTNLLHRSSTCRTKRPPTASIRPARPSCAASWR